MVQARGTKTIRIKPPPRGVDLNLAEAWAHRELLYFFVWRQLKLRYKQTVIGAGWAILQPLLTMLTFSLIFGRLARLPSDGLPYPVFYYTGLLPWMYFTNALTAATNTMVDHQRVITKVYFPRILLPVAAVLAGLADFAIALMVMLVLMPMYGVSVTAAVLALPVFLLLALLTAVGVGLWLSALYAVYRDVRYLLPFLVMLWMFLSPVVYPSTMVPERWRWLYGVNPMAGVIDGFRWALTGSAQPSGSLLVASTAAVGLLLLGGVICFQRLEATIADVV